MAFWQVGKHNPRSGAAEDGSRSEHRLRPRCGVAVEAPAQQLAFAPDGRTFLGVTTTEQPRTIHTFSRWDLGSREVLGSLPVHVSAEPVRAFHCLSRDGKVMFLRQEPGGGIQQNKD